MNTAFCILNTKSLYENNLIPENINYSEIKIYDEESITAAYDRCKIDLQPIEDSLNLDQIKANLTIGSPITVLHNFSNRDESIISSLDILALDNNINFPIIDPNTRFLTKAEDNLTIYDLESIIPPDNRTRITPTISYPWSTICKLYIIAADDNISIASGVIIDEFHILTAGHCVYIHEHGGFIKVVKVIPAMDNSYDPYGYAWVTDVRLYSEWIEHQSLEHDWAVLTLDRNIGSYTGWMEIMTADSSNSIYTDIMNVAGYPGDLDNGNSMYWDSDNGDCATEYLHFYWADTEQGMSGSPIWRNVSDIPYILSVHTSGGNPNFGTRLNQEKYESIITWLGEDASNPPIDKPDMEDRGSSYSGYNTDTVIAGKTYFSVWSDVRNIGTTSTGSFTITYYASTDTIISSTDYFLGSDSLSSIESFNYANSSWSGTFPANILDGNYYIGWIIDPSDSVDEFNESNNIAYLRNPITVGIAEEWYRTWGNINDDYGRGIAIDSYDNIYIIGDIDTGDYWRTRDIFLTKSNTLGVEQWNRKYDYGMTSYPDYGYGIAIDSSNYIYTLGSSREPFSASPFSGYYSIILNKYNIFGELQVGSIASVSSSFQKAYGIAIDSSDNIYIVGEKYSYQTSSYDILITKYNNTLSRKWSKTWGGSGVDIGYRVAMDSSDNIYILGETSSFGEGKRDMCLLKYNSSGTQIWGITWGGNEDDYGKGIAVDSLDNVYIVGETASFGEGKRDMYLLKLNSSGGWIWGFTWGGSEDDWGNGIFIDSFDNIYLVGETSSFGEGEFDICLLKCDSSGTLLWDDMWGNTDYDSGFGVSVDSSNNIYVVGCTKSYGAGNLDIILIKYSVASDSRAITVISPTGSSLWETGNSYSIEWAWTGSISNVKIELFKSDSPERVIIASTVNDGIYEWIVPTDLADSTQYHIKISDTSNPSIFDDSDDFKIFTPKTIIITSPTSSSLWEIGSSYLIEWAWTGSISNVKIELFKSDSLERVIVASTVNDGIYEWMVPLDLADSAQYKIKVSDTLDPSIFDENEEFEIYKPFLTIMSPDSLSEWDTGASYYIYWISRGSIDNVKIELYKEGGFVMEISVSTSNDGEYYWTIPLTLEDSTQYQIKISAVSNPSIFNESDKFEIYTPFLTVTSPNNSCNWERGTSYYIYWTSRGSIDNVKIELYIEGGFVMEISVSTSNDGEYYWMIPLTLEDSTQYQIKISAVSNPSIFDESDYFEIYLPYIIVLSPDSSCHCETGDSYYIYWVSRGSIDNVKIELYENDVFVMEISASTPNDDEFYWTIPLTLEDSTQYQIKISNASDPSIFDDSDYFEIYTPFLIVTSPESLSEWEIGASYYIYWTSRGSIDTVKIELFKSGSLERIIVSSTANDGSYEWTVPNNLADSTQYQIRIIDVSEPSIFNESDYFEIYTPFLTIISPDSLSEWETGASYSIYWTFRGSFANVKIELYKEGGFEMEISGNTPNDGEYYWTIPLTLVDSTQYQIKISDASDPSLFDDSYNFEIYTPKTITITNPSSSSSWATGSSYLIEWFWTGSILNVKIELFKSGSLERVIVASAANDGSYEWMVPTDLADSTQYQIKINDALDPSIFDDSVEFEIFTPFLTVISPDSSCHWEASVSYSIYWTSKGDIDTVKIELYKEGGFEMEISESTPNDGEFYWTIPSELADSTKYQIKIIDVSDPSIFDDSGEFEINTPKTITIISPMDSSSWKTGTSYYIYWTSTGSISQVKIELYKDSVFEMEISASTPNDGEYYWLIPSGLFDSVLYQIRVNDVSDPSIFDNSDSFEIDSNLEEPIIPGYEVMILFVSIIAVSIVLIKNRLRCIFKFFYK